MTSTDLMNVSAFKGVAPAAAFGALNPQSESLADGIGSGYGVIHYKGKVWRLRHRGETYNFNRPDDGTPAPFLDVIILRQLGVKSKSYYPAGSFVDGNDGSRPLCSALDGVTPDRDVVKPEAAACAICPRNEFRLNAEGKKVRECADYKRLAVLIIPSLTTRLLGAALMEPVFLRIPPASLNDLGVLGDAMNGQGFHYSSYITRIGFNPDKPHPQMTFRALQPLGDNEGPVVMAMREEPQCYRITGENEVGKSRAVAGAASQPQRQQPENNVVSLNGQQRQTASVSTMTTTSPSETGPVDTGFGGVAQPTKPGAGTLIDVTPTVVSTGFAAAPNGGEGLVEAGFGGLGQTNQMVDGHSAGPMANTVEDVGAPEASDVDLDAKVAALLGR